MRTIICKKCGAEIDAALGECPKCGAVYYILPSDEEKKLEWAMSTEPDVDETQAFVSSEAPQTHGGTVHSTRDIINADNDELFNTRVWKISDEPDATRTIHTQGMERAKTPIPPVRRPTAQNPVQQNARAAGLRGAASNNQSSQKKEQDLRKKQFVVAAIALLAVLTLVLSIMGGLFDFSGSGDDTNKMPSVIGMPQESATALLEGKGLVVTPITEISDELAGTVIKQSIKENRKFKEGDSVTITVSSGKSTENTATPAAVYIDVPTLTGKTYDEANMILTKLNLVITKAEDAFSDEDIGTIISQNPMKGAKLQKGDVVTVTLSKGPEITEHVITVTAGKGGSISPKGIVNVADGGDQSFTITPDDGHDVFEVKVDGTSIGGVTSYTFMGVSDDHTIYVVFKKSASESPSPSVSPTDTPTSEPDITG